MNRNAIASTAGAILLMALSSFLGRPEQVIDESSLSMVMNQGTGTVQKRPSEPVGAIASGLLGLALAGFAVKEVFSGASEAGASRVPKERAIAQLQKPVREPVVESPEEQGDRSASTTPPGLTDFALDDPWGIETEAEAEDEDGSPAIDENTLVVNLGRSPSTGKDINWVPSINGAGFLFVVGGSDSGKTETLKVVASEVASFGVPFFMVDFHGDLKAAVPHETYKISYDQNSWSFNPLRLVVKDPDFGGIIRHVDSFIAGLKKVCNVGKLQQDMLRDILFLAYRKKGITNSPDTWDKECPVMVDVIRLIDQEIIDNSPYGEDKGNPEAVRSLTGLRASIRTVFDSPVFKGKEIDIPALCQSNTRIDLASLLDPGLQEMASKAIINGVMQYLRSLGEIDVQPKSDREKYRLLLVVDEAKIFGGGKDKDDPFNVVNRGCTEFRKYGLAAAFGCQRLSHFPEESRSQINSVVCLKIGKSLQDRKSVSEDADIPLAMINALKGKGHGIYTDTYGMEEVQVTPTFKRDYSDVVKVQAKVEVQGVSKTNVVQFPKAVNK